MSLIMVVFLLGSKTHLFFWMFFLLTSSLPSLTLFVYLWVCLFTCYSLQIQGYPIKRLYKSLLSFTPN